MNSRSPDVKPHCPLCNGPVEHREFVDTSFNIGVDCKCCGRFKITMEACESLKPEQKYLLSATCRTWPDKTPPTILSSNIESLTRRAPVLSVPEKLDTMLELIAQRTDELGARSTFDIATDYPLLVLRGPEEGEFLLRALDEQKYITLTLQSPIVTAEGWRRVDQIRGSGRASRLAFVAMWFDSSTAELYDNAIRPAIIEAGYEPLRIDRHEHVNRIDDEIIGQIRRSRFIVADFTGQRHGVYFEAGLMMGLGRNVIWMCNKQELLNHNLHFDVRQYNFIDWDSIEDARARLRNRILAIEGEGPGQPETER